jgi:hypothetical protein
MSQEGIYAICARLLGPAAACAEMRNAGLPESQLMTRMEWVVLAYNGKLARKDKRMILASFATVDAASLAACEIQRRCFGIRRTHPRPLILNIGIHRVAKPCLRRTSFSGVDERRDNDRRFGFGKAMLLAGKSAGDKVLLSDMVFRALMPDLRRQCILRDSALGFPIYDLDWNKVLSMHTRVSLFDPPLPPPSDKQLMLRVGANRLVIGHMNGVAIFGRDPACDVIIPDKLVSREHACIEIHPDGCLLTDHSVNGTNVVFHDGQKMLVKNQSIFLEGRGHITLGRIADRNTVGSIEFRVQHLWKHSRISRSFRNTPVERDGEPEIREPGIGSFSERLEPAILIGSV